MNKHKTRKAKGFFITPCALVGEDGDIDNPTFWEGDNLEKALGDAVRRGELWICDGCNDSFFEEEDAKDHEEDCKYDD